MSSFRLNVQIAMEDLRLLKEAGYNFCLSRDTIFAGSTRHGNVVFVEVNNRSLAPNLAISWQDRFQIFGTSRFEPGIIVEIVTQAAPIQEGQQATIDPNGTIQVAGNPQPGRPLSLINDWKQPANIGLSAFVDTTGTYNTFFISPPVLLDSRTTILPSRRYSVFWDRNLSSGTMFDSSQTSAFSFEFEGTNQVTIRYADGRWYIAN